MASHLSINMSAYLVRGKIGADKNAKRARKFLRSPVYQIGHQNVGKSAPRRDAVVFARTTRASVDRNLFACLCIWGWARRGCCCRTTLQSQPKATSCVASTCLRTHFDDANSTRVDARAHTHSLKKTFLICWQRSHASSVPSPPRHTRTHYHHSSCAIGAAKTAVSITNKLDPALTTRICRRRSAASIACWHCLCGFASKFLHRVALYSIYTLSFLHYALYALESRGLEQVRTKNRPHGPSPANCEIYMLCVVVVLGESIIQDDLLPQYLTDKDTKSPTIPLEILFNN